MTEMLKWRSAKGNPSWTPAERQHHFDVIECNVRKLYTEDQLRSTLEKLLHDELCLVDELLGKGKMTVDIVRMGSVSKEIQLASTNSTERGR